jgi:hypothetical protein
MRRATLSIGLVLCGSLLTAAESRAAEKTAANCGYAAVAAAIGAAAEGDIVNIPAGTCDWTQNLTIEKGVTLRGAGIGQTIILDSVPATAKPFQLLTIKLAENQTTRVTGIEFRAGNRTTWSIWALMHIEGTNLDARRLRVDNCKFDQLWRPVFFFDTVLGVVDHNVVQIRANNQGGLAQVKDYNWSGRSFGDGAWAEPNKFGSDEFLFFEDNEVTHLGVDRHVTLLDGQAGARYVFRNNTVTRGSIEGHGTESGNRERSTRAVEVYNNTFIGSNKGQLVTYFRGGVGLVHGNRVTGYQQAPGLHLLSNRNTDSYAVWGGADGVNPWDKNGSLVPYAIGVTASSGTLTMTALATKWTTNQWAGYVLRRVTNLGNLTGSAFSEIAGNTADTLTFKSSLWGAMKFTTGDAFEIRKVEHTMDQPGRSGGGLLSGGTPVRPLGWNNQVTDPWYEWNNTRDGGLDMHLVASHKTIRENEHFFNDREPAGYTPFEYPHPLTLGLAPSQRKAPSNVRITYGD